MSVPTPTQSIFVPIPQPEPREGRAAIPVTEANGAPLNFVTGSEVFQWTSNSMQAQGRRPSGILSAWLDATGLTAGKNLIVSNGTIQVEIAGGSQSYVLLPTPLPGTVTISTNGGTGTVTVVLFNFNVNALGSYVVAGSSGSGSGAGSSGGGGGGGYAPTGGGDSGGHMLL